MFENITQLENEVKEFHQNILASQDLLKRLDSLIRTVSEEHKGVISETEAVNQSILEKSQAVASLLEVSKNEVQQSNQNLQEQFRIHSDKICSSSAEDTNSVCSTVSQAVETIISGNQVTLAQIQQQCDSVTSKAGNVADAISDRNNKVITDITAGISELNSSLLDAGKQHLDAVSTTVSQATETITASNQDTLNQIQAQYNSVSESTANTLKEISNGNAQVISDIRACINELETSLTSAGNQQLSTNKQMLQETIQHINQMLTDLLKNLSQQNLTIMQNTSNEIFMQLNGCSQNLQNSMHILEQSRHDLQLKYDEFIQAMSSDNLRKICQEIERFEKSTNLKFTLMFTGIGITAMLVILSIFF